jgi:hypothetical protein
MYVEYDLLHTGVYLLWLSLHDDYVELADVAPYRFEYRFVHK